MHKGKMNGFILSKYLENCKVFNCFQGILIYQMNKTCLFYLCI